MALDVEAEVLIDRSRGEVAALATDPANDTRWIGGVDRVRRLDEGLIGAIRVCGEARGAIRLARALLGPMVRRSVAADLRRLKALAEGHGGA